MENPREKDKESNNSSDCRSVNCIENEAHKKRPSIKSVDDKVKEKK